MKLEELKKKLAELLAQAGSLVAKKPEDFTEADASAIEKINAEISDLKTKIETAQKQADAFAALREQVAKSGSALEVKDGTSIESGEPAILKSEHGGFKTFGERVMAIRNAALNPESTDKRLVQYEAAASGANIGSGAEGGFLLTPQESQQIFTRIFTDDIDLSQCQKFVLTNGTGVEVNALADADKSGLTTRYGGVACYWLKEAGTPTAGKPNWEKVKFELNYLVALAYATEQELRFVANYGDRLTSLFSAAIAGELKEAVMFGTGAGKPLGVFSTNNSALISITKETNQKADTVLAENIGKMWMRVHTPSKANAKWFYNFEVGPQLDQMYIAVGSSGIPVYMPMGGFSGLPYATLKGRPALEDEHMAALGDAGDIGIVDWSQYGIATDSATIGGLTMAMSMHVKFTTLENAFRVYTSIDGRPLWKNYITPRKGGSGSYQSPFVTLAERA